MDSNDLDEEELLLCAFDGDFDRVRELVETHRVNVNCVDEEDGMTPLMHAAWRGHFRIVRFLLGNGADVRAADNDGKTALSYAVYERNAAMAQLLLTHNANVDARIFSFRTAFEFSHSLLAWAIDKEMVEMVEVLLRFGANTEETLFYGKTYTALFLACWGSNLEIVQLLLNHDNGLHVNAFVPRGHEEDGSPAMSPLCQACRRNNLEMVQLLIQRGARVIYNGVFPDSPCPLVHAVDHETTVLLWFLLDQTNLQGEVGNDNHPLSPALEAAIECNKLQAAQLLVDRGANVNDRAFLWHCANYEPNRWLPHDDRIGIARLLLLRAAGANVNLAEPERGETPLWAAAKNGHVEMVKDFLKARADVRIRDSHNGETPLGVAYRQGHKGIVYLLLRTSPHVWPHLAGALFGCPVANDTQEPAPKKQKTS